MIRLANSRFITFTWFSETDCMEKIIFDNFLSVANWSSVPMFAGWKQEKNASGGKMLKQALVTFLARLCRTG